MWIKTADSNLINVGETVALVVSLGVGKGGHSLVARVSAGNSVTIVSGAEEACRRRLAQI